MAQWLVESHGSIEPTIVVKAYGVEIRWPTIVVLKFFKAGILIRKALAVLDNERAFPVGLDGALEMLLYEIWVVDHGVP
jgi:hypothetical protein